MATDKRAGRSSSADVRSTSASITGIYDGFEGYRTPSPEEQANALRTALVVLDTNVLLSLYRFATTTTDDLLRVLGNIGDRLWVPHQVMLEFWRNRLAALGNHRSAADQARTTLQKQQQGTSDVVDRWANAIALDQHVAEDLQSAIEDLFHQLESAISGRQSADSGASSRTYQDSILARIEQVLAGRVAKPVATEARAAQISEGKRRIENKIPPGYMDAEKEESDREEGATGDYLIWRESLEEAKNRGMNLLIVTGDVKQDWWVRHRSELLGPRVELVQEVRDFADKALYLMRPADLLVHADAVNVSINQSSLEEVARIDTAEQGSPSWNATGVAELLRRLDLEGREQAAVIRAAAAEGGMIDRDSLYALAGYDDDRMLRGFTRPSSRITRDLQLEGILPSDVEPMLSPRYIGVRAAGFNVPESVVRILNDSLAITPMTE